jgi:hypothetical protein
VTFVVGRPQIVVGIDAQAVRMLEQPVAETADEFPVIVVFGLARWNRKTWPFEFNATPEASPTAAPGGVSKKLGIAL